MSWLDFIPSIFRSGKDVAEVFVENKENQGERQHLETLSDMGLTQETIQQFAAEFHARSSRTWWDSFIDGLNRLPRPLLTLAVIGFFILAPLDPERFLLVAKAYEVIPTGYWGLLSVIVGFYFGGRMQLKQAEMKLSSDHVKAAKELVNMRQAFKESRDIENQKTDMDYDNAIKNGVKKPANPVIKAWQEQNNK